MLSIHPRFQGRGFGRSIVAAVESYFRARGCHAVDIQVVNLREELPPFYERLATTRRHATVSARRLGDEAVISS